MNSIAIYQSNRLEWLADCLTHRIRQARRSSFSLVPDVVLVNNYELAQWLSIRMAERSGVCANIRFSLVGSYIWKLVSVLFNDIEEQDKDENVIFTRAHLRWLCYGILARVLNNQDSDDAVLRLRKYLSHHGDLGAFELSGQLADLFDRYMNYRPDMLLDWELGRDDEASWQGTFWRRLSRLAKGKFRLSRLLGLIEGLRSGKSTAIDNKLSQFLHLLPSRLYIFGISYMPPLHMEVLKGLSSKTALEIFHLSPCKEYWFHIVNQKGRAKLLKRYDQNTLERLFPLGNRLLASLGLSGRRFLERLYDMDVAEGREHFRCSKSNTLLNEIQRGIVELTDSIETKAFRSNIVSEDDSLQIHSCHSRLREVEIIHDRLIGLFRKDSKLKPHEVVVMAPDISKYAKYIEAVFSSVPKERFIPWSLCDVGQAEFDPMVHAFLSLLDIPEGEFTAPALLDILSMPCVAERFGLDGSSLSIIRHWVSDSGVRRGINRLSPSCPEYINTWLFGLDRLMTSALMDKEAHLRNDNRFSMQILPVDYPVEGGAADILSTLSSFVFALQALSERIKSTRGKGFSPGQWLEFFKDLISRFISSDLDDEHVRHVLLEPLEKFCKLLDQCHVDTLEYEVVRQALIQEFSNPTSPRAYMSGKVIFSSLVPMRAIPFKVICLMGMNHGEFPRQVTRPAFDLMVNSPRPFDPNPTDEDRYLFLETILSARQKLIITYVGRSQRDDSELNPSSVVSEILDYTSELINDQNVTKNNIIYKHPLQPFSIRYLHERDPRKKTYANEWLPVDKNGRLLEQKDPEPICIRSVPTDDLFDSQIFQGQTIDVLEITPSFFAFFLANPAKGLLKHRLNINLELGNGVLLDHEPFEISLEVDKAVVERIFYHLMGSDERCVSLPQDESDLFFTDFFGEYTLKGHIPHGRLGMFLWKKRIKNVYLPLVKRLIKEGFPVSIMQTKQTYQLGNGRHLVLKGDLGKIKDDGGLIELAANLTSAGRMVCWTRHLLHCMDFGFTNKKVSQSLLLTWKDQKRLRIEGMNRKEAEDNLFLLIETFLSALEGDTLFLPAPSYLAAKAVQSSKGKKARWEELSEEEIRKAKSAALEGFFHFQNRDGMSNPWISYLFRGNRIRLKKYIESEQFLKHAIEVCGPLLYWMTSGR